ncbi:Zinc finger protein 2 [Echinococcus granulosus]|uniref:Zinc finger protein 2 n=1 Tax=Echinococcus granulosus TaxID=6210 RepID=W6UNN2_ECHGR|nr:Zinc finger protein 2 [Echinococcus granulosus]EUB62843.1 Zinc finger protein 2 [Echinococcus granulosus]
MNLPMVEPSVANFNAERAHVMVSPPAIPEMETGNSGCIYCLTKVLHPRLGRGESYACGYKPYRCEICNYSTVTKGNLAIHEQSDRHLNNVQEYDQHQKLQCVHKPSEQDSVNSSVSHPPASANQSSPPTMSLFPQTYLAFLEVFSQKGGTCPMDDFSTDLLEVADHTFFCQICGVFGTDSVEELISHAEQNRIPKNLDLANQQLTTHTSGAWHCNLCSYRSPLKANFQLHCKTEKHAQRLSLLLHVWEGKEGRLGASLPTNDLLLSSTSKNSVYCQLRCLPCGFFTCSVHKMRVHCQTPMHGFLASAFGAVVRRRSQLKLSLMTASDGGSVMNGARVIYACRKCEMTFTSLTGLMQHFQSADFHETVSKKFNLRRFNSIVLNTSLDDEGSRIRRHSAPPTINAEFSSTSDQSRKRSIEYDNGGNVSAMNDAQMPQSLLAGATCQTLTDGENAHCRMHITTSPLSSWLNCVNLQNSELLQGLARFIDEQKEQTSAPQTCDSLFAWFGADNTLCSFLISWLRHQFPQMDGNMSDEFVAFILELIAQQPNVLGRFLDLRELQQRQAFSTCHQCSPPRSFLLPSSTSLHFNIHHNDELPALVLEAVKKMENTVIEVVRALQPQQFQLPLMKGGRTRLSVNHLEVFRSSFCSSNQITEATIAEICKKTGLEEKAVKHWFRGTLFKGRQRFKEDSSNLDIPQPPINQASATEHSDEVRSVGRSTKPTSTKRFRTPISSIQQAVLLQYFQADQNPSRRQMDIISSEVNLPKRVVQVWFQNARSRERRMFIKEASAQESPFNELKCLVSGANSTNTLPEQTPVDKLQQIFNQILTQMPPLGIIQPPASAPIQPPVTSIPQQLPSQSSENYEMDSPLDLSTVSYRSNDYQSSTLQNLSPHAGSAASANETRSDSFCRRNRTSISSTQARFMQWFFQHHKTPTICECENIGRAIGLSRRVVQVWFQNQRAKKKKLARSTAICSEASFHQPESESQFLLEGNECKLCNVKIRRMSEEDTAAVTEHIFSTVHIDRLFATICQGDLWSAAVERQQNCPPEPKHE